VARNPHTLWERLDRDALATLRGIESLMSKYEYVPVEVLERRVRVPGPRLARALNLLNSLKLIRRKLGGIVGYTLTYTGLDVIAYDALRRRRVLAALGERLGVGKEGEVYLGVTPEGDYVVVKFHREGRRSFSHIRRLRHYATSVDRKQWFRLAKLVGEREYKILVVLDELGALVPRPVSWNRNAVVQELVPGVDLYKVKGGLDPDVARQVFDDVVETVRVAYQKAGVVHGDLSEYNILVSEDGRGYVIDWPQYVYREDPQAEELLRRDIQYLVSYFRRKYGLQATPEEVLAYVKGG